MFCTFPEVAVATLGSIRISAALMNTEPPRKSRRRRRRSPSVIFLPDELITDILSRLPVKPLMKMQCVCKSWKTLISDPTFIKMHLNLSSARNPHLSLFTYKKSSFVHFPVSHLLENRYITVSKDPYYRFNDKDVRQVVGSCNGLFCLVGYSHNMGMWLRFWNPATRKISDKLGYLHDVMYALGSWKFVLCYDNSTDTYKVVALQLMGGFKSKPNIEVSIFSLNDNVWRTIQSFPFAPRRVFYGRWGVYGGVQFGCTVNWLAPNVIISLDLSSETYTQWMLPFEKLARSSNVCVLRNFFCFYHDLNGTGFVIWKMTEFGDDKSWTQFLKISYHNIRMNHKLRIDHSRVDDLHLNLKPVHLSENGDTVVFVNNLQNQAILYNLRNNTVLKCRINHKIWWFAINDYVESLVSTC